MTPERCIPVPFRWGGFGHDMNYSATDMLSSNELNDADHDNNNDDDDDSSRSWQTMAFDRVTLVKQYRIHHPRIYMFMGRINRQNMGG